MRTLEAIRKNILRMSLAGLSLMVSALSLVSCSGDYVDAIPDGSRALISIDLQAAGTPNGQQADVLKSALGVDDPSDCGIDLQEKIYLFSAPDGNLGLCAKVGDEGDLSDWLAAKAKAGECGKVQTFRDCHFTVFHDSWMLGYGKHALLLMGPVVASAQPALRQTMAKYLTQDSDHGVKSSLLFHRLDSIDSPMALVAQAQALPEKFIAPFTLGAPKDADASQVIIAASMNVDGGVLDIQGETFSFNPRVDKALKEARSVYRPITGRYAATMPGDAVAGMFLNVDGSKFLPLMRTNRGLQALLAGVNQAIDMDNIMRSVDGDMAVILPALGDADAQVMMGAKLGNCQWTGDVDYWKQSVPEGGRIADWGDKAWLYTDGHTSFYFGVSPDLQFYAGSGELMAQYAIRASNHPIPASLQKHIKGQRLVLIVNLGNGAGRSSALSAVSELVRPLFGQLNAIVYTLK